MPAYTNACKFLRHPLAYIKTHPHRTWVVSHIAFFLLNIAKVVLFRDLLVDDPFNLQTFFANYVTSAAFLFIIFAATFATGNRMLLCGAYGCQLLYLTANLVYYHAFGYYIYLEDLVHLLPSLYSILKARAFSVDWWCLGFLADLPFLIIMVHSRALPRVPLRSAYTRALLLGMSALAVATVGFWSFSAVYGADSNPSDPHERDHRYIRQHGLMAFTIYDYFTAARSQRMGYLQVSHHYQRFEAKPVKRNIYLIQVEALDARIVGFEYKGQPVMPFMHRLRHESVYYPFTLSVHTGGGTSDCDFTILNSVEPIKHTSVFFLEAYDYPNSVVRLLNCNGYHAYAFHGNKSSCWARDVAYPRMGYADFYDLERMKLVERGWGAPDEEIFRNAQEFISRRKPPLFVHVITMSSHFPYNGVENYYHYEAMDVPDDPMAQRYFNSMNYVDGCLENYVNFLRKRNDGVIVIVGDHAPPKVLTKYFNQSKLDLRGKPLEFVPLFIIAPELAPREETRNVASFLDIAPTMLSLSGVPCTYPTDGIDLTAPPAKPPPIRFDSQVYARDDLFKYCRWKLP